MEGKGGEERSLGVGGGWGGVSLSAVGVMPLTSDNRDRRYGKGCLFTLVLFTLVLFYTLYLVSRATPQQLLPTVGEDTHMGLHTYTTCHL